MKDWLKTGIIESLALFMAAPVAFASDNAYRLERSVERVERQVIDARQSGAISAEAYGSLQLKITTIRTMREEAMSDGLVTVKERESVHRLIQDVEMDMAEARFGPKEKSAPVVMARRETGRRYTQSRRPQESAKEHGVGSAQ